jgi:hypothetical protein
MKIEMLRDVTGTFHNIVDGVRTGDVIEIDAQNGSRYVKLGYARPSDKPVTVVASSDIHY